MEGGMMMILIILLSWIAAAWICGHLAGKKGRSVVTWVILGLVFGWIAVLIVACLNTDVAALRAKAVENKVLWPPTQDRDEGVPWRKKEM